jgi:hypothetical protein
MRSIARARPNSKAMEVEEEEDEEGEISHHEKQSRLFRYGSFTD